MDRLTIFSSATNEVTIKSEENNTIDTVVDGLSDIERELKLTRKGHEVGTWGEAVEDMEDVELDDISEEVIEL